MNENQLKLKQQQQQELKTSSYITNPPAPKKQRFLESFGFVKNGDENPNDVVQFERERIEYYNGTPMKETKLQTQTTQPNRFQDTPIPAKLASTVVSQQAAPDTIKLKFALNNTIVAELTATPTYTIDRARRYVADKLNKPFKAIKLMHVKRIVSIHDNE